MTIVQMQKRGGNRSVGRSKHPIVAALDIGSTKICCMIAEKAGRPGKDGSDPRSSLKVIGFANVADAIKIVIGRCNMKKFALTETNLRQS